jgi:hypothetical protein
VPKIKHEITDYRPGKHEGRQSRRRCTRRAAGLRKWHHTRHILPPGLLFPIAVLPIPIGAFLPELNPAPGNAFAQNHGQALQRHRPYAPAGSALSCNRAYRKRRYCRQTFRTRQWRCCSCRQSHRRQSLPPRAADPGLPQLSRLQSVGTCRQRQGNADVTLRGPEGVKRALRTRGVVATGSWLRIGTSTGCPPSSPCTACARSAHSFRYFLLSRSPRPGGGDSYGKTQNAIGTSAAGTSLGGAHEQAPFSGLVVWSKWRAPCRTADPQGRPGRTRRGAGDSSRTESPRHARRRRRTSLAPRRSCPFSRPRRRSGRERARRGGGGCAEASVAGVACWRNNAMHTCVCWRDVRKKHRRLPARGERRRDT